LLGVRHTTVNPRRRVEGSRRASGRDKGFDPGQDFEVGACGSKGGGSVLVLTMDFTIVCDAAGAYLMAGSAL
jgi:hypothetical protein